MDLLLFLFQLFRSRRNLSLTCARDNLEFNYWQTEKEREKPSLSFSIYNLNVRKIIS